MSSPPKKAKASKAVKAWVAKRVKHLGELKNHDVNASGSLSTSTFAQYLLNGISQGTGGQQRIGRQLLAEQIDVKISFKLNAANLTGDQLRITLVKDVECRGAACAYGDVLENNSFGAVTICSPLNMSNCIVDKRFQVYYDKVLDLNQTSNVSATVSGGLYRQVNFKVKPKSLIKYYDTSNGDITDIDNGALYLFIQGSVASNPSSVQVFTRLTYRDP